MMPLLWVLLACRGNDPEPTTDGPAETADTATLSECTDLSWENFGYGFFQTWCNSCHSSHLEGVNRQGAPDGMDFEYIDDVRFYAERIVARAATTPPTMPEAGGTTELERQHLDEWIACGAPGADLPQPLCTNLTVSDGDHSFTSQSDADAFCDGEANAVGGGLVLGAGVEVPCLCDVAGDLSVTASGGAVSIEELRHVGGSLVLADSGVTSFEVPHLEAVDGDLTLSAASALVEVDTRVLSVVGGDVALLDNPELVVPDLSRLVTVGGAVTIRGNDALVDLFRPTQSLVTVGGAIEVGDNASLTNLGFLSVESVGGAIDIHDNDAMVELSGFTFGFGFGDVAIHDMAGMVELKGFDNARELGSLSIAGNPEMQAITGFVNLGTVAGDVLLDDLAVLDALDGLAALEQVGSFTVSKWGIAANVVGLEGLHTVDGDLVFRSNASMKKPKGIGIETVGGSVVVESNPSMTDMGDLFTITSIGGDLAFRDNPLLPSDLVLQLADYIGPENIGGELVNEGNDG